MAVSIRTLIPKNRLGRVPAASARHRVAKLPLPYQYFFGEWKDSPGSPVHWIPSTVNWKRDPVTGVVQQVKDRPIPVKYPDQIHYGLWGGEGVIEGLVKKAKFRSPVPRFWVPQLKRSVVYSEVLDVYLSVTVTERALQLIDQHNGLDGYLLQNPANELKSLLALKLKRKILMALATGNFAQDNPEKHQQLLEKYKEHLMPVEEIEWYGLSLLEAEAKHKASLDKEKQSSINPLKHRLRQELVQQLREGHGSMGDMIAIESKSWVSKLNPFAKPENLKDKPVQN